jgi:DNA-binding Lrp family transcriptional regulator
MSMAKRGVSNHRIDAMDISVAGIDSVDVKIIDLLIGGLKSRQIAERLDRPLSTVQRRIRKLFEEGIVKSSVELAYKRLGLKRGDLFVYLRSGDVRSIADRIAGMEGILDVSIHIGNSDIMGRFMYTDSAHLLEFTSRVRQLEGVERVVWSEEVYQVPLKNSVSLEPILAWPQSQITQ